MQLAGVETTERARVPQTLVPRSRRVTALRCGAGAPQWWWRKSASTPTLTSVAVLRFENAGRDATLDYLGLALPDEIATLLTKSPELAVRPVEYVDGKDPIAAALRTASITS